MAKNKYTNRKKKTKKKNNKPIKPTKPAEAEKKRIVKVAMENPKIMKELNERGIMSTKAKKLMEKSLDKSGPSPKKIGIKHGPKENKKPRMFGKISGFFSESEDEKKTRLIEKNNLKKVLGAEESVLMSNNSPYIFALMWLISEKRV